MTNCQVLPDKKDKDRKDKKAKSSSKINNKIKNNNKIKTIKKIKLDNQNSPRSSAKRIPDNLEQGLNNQKKVEKVKNILEYKDDEINSLSYELAIQNDKRTYCLYYISLIKTKHSLVFSFFLLKIIMQK